MPTSVLTRQRSWVARIAVLAMLASLLVIGAVPASAAVNDTSASCPASIPSAGFTDIATYDATTQAAINCIADYGITKGTSATTYGPAIAVARWQMALFLTRQAAVHGVALPSGADQGFTDISGLDAATQTAINQLAQLGISKGTSATTFSPNDDVTREQMALFLARLLSAVTTLPAAPASAGFTDIADLSAESQLAINQLAQVGVAAGTSATTFDPASDVLRWQMALFLTRVLAEDNVVPAGKGNFVTAFDAVNDKYTYSDVAACKSTTVTYKSTDKFFVNGNPATLAAFEAALGALAPVTNNIKVDSGTAIHTLTTGVKVTEGPLDTNGFPGISITDPVTGFQLAATAAGAPYDFYVIDGAAATVAAWLADASAGDQVKVSGGDGSTAAKARTFTLTNGSVSGTVSGGGIDIDTACQTFTVGVPAVGDSITVDGKADTVLTGLSNGDTLVFSRAASKSTWVLTNAAPAAVTGEAQFTNGGALVAPAFRVATSSTAFVDLNWTTDNDGGAWDTLLVNGSAATVVDFQNALTPGDVIVYRFADATTSTKSSLALTDAGYSGAPASYVGTNLAVYSTGTSGQTLDAVDITALNPLGFTGNTAVKYTVNGASATQGVFEANVAAAIANKNGNVSVSDSGTDTVWALTTP